MEQPEPSTPTTTPADTTTAVSQVTKQSPINNTTHEPVPDFTPLAQSEPSPATRIDPATPNTSSTSSSVPSLRFPRPLGNRQLTNWVSSSSPDIMQPGNINHEDEVSLAELGYDIIGTDGESQAESTTSSLDYQRADDVQSLIGTDTGTDVDTNDVDTDSSDEEEVTLTDDDPHTTDQGVVSADDEELAEEEDASVESLADQSLENPTSFERYGLPHIRSPAASQQGLDKVSGISTDVAQPSSHEEETAEDRQVRDDSTTDTKPPGLITTYFGLNSTTLRDSLDFAKQFIPDLVFYLLVISGFTFFLAADYYMNTPAPRALSTVPVAAVSSVTAPSASDLSSTFTSPSTPVVSLTKTPNALQTGSSSNSLALKYLGGKEKTEPADSHLTSQKTVCSVELLGNNEIMIAVPENIKSPWLAKDAIMIAVSRGIYDIPTKVSSVKEGFVIQVPPQEAHGLLNIYVATTRKPKVNEAFQIDLSRHVFTEALDAGKQLVVGFAQRVVDTVNGTTAWVEETYSPAFDLVSKQVSVRTASMTDSVLQRVKEIKTTALGMPTRILSRVTERFGPSLNGDILTRRANQVQLELTRQAQDIRDGLSLRLLTAQLNSKLFWLKVQGKEEEYRHYMTNAAAYYKQKQADVLDARRERAAHVKNEICSQRKQARQSPRAAFWKKCAGAH